MENLTLDAEQDILTILHYMRQSLSANDLDQLAKEVTSLFKILDASESYE